MSWLEVVLRLAVALACGALIGIERQYRQHSAGLRTSALVATGSALFVLVAALTPGDTSPLRVAAQVVSCISHARFCFFCHSLDWLVKGLSGLMIDFRTNPGYTSDCRSAKSKRSGST
jgi:MgtC family protein